METHKAPAEVPGASVDDERIRQSIRTAVRRLGPRLTAVSSVAVLAVLAGAVAAPLVPPILAVGATGLAAGTVGRLLQGTTENLIANFVADFVSERGKERVSALVDAPDGELQAELARELEGKLAADGDQAAALRAELATLLQAVGGVETALDAATDDVKAALAQGLTELGASFEEFRWVLDEVHEAVFEIQRTTSVNLTLTRETLAKVNLLLRRPPTAAMPTRDSAAGADAEAPFVGLPDSEPPYKGLESFQPEDADHFFGRERDVSELVARLAEARFLAIVGSSGSGKSSVLRAGLLPAIWQGAVPGGADWKTLLFQPGRRPVDELAVQLSSLGNLSPGSIASDLRADPRHAVLAAKQALVGDTERTRLFFAVDQFEEIFTLCRDEDERSCFIEALLELASEERCPAVVVIGMRADFYGRCATYPRLASSLQDHQGLIGPMGLRELREAIERPAAAAGLVLEPGLVDEILADIADEPGALPLLQHALLETWKRRDGRRLTLRGYQEAGTIREAIARTAEGMFETLPDDQRAIVKSVFLRLTEPGEGTEDTRRRVHRSELGSGRAEIAEVLDTLASERLVTLGPDTVEVAHEALIREWPRLRRWLDEDREGLRIHRRLTEDARTWEDLDRDPGALYRGARLQAASEWAERHPGDLNPLEQSFLETSRSTEQSEVEAVRTRNRRLRLLAAGLGVLLAIALVSAGFALLATRRAEREAAGATSAALASDALETLDNQVDVALLLALEAFRRDDTPQARSALLAGVQRTVGLDRLFSADAGVYAVAYSPDGRTIASAGLDGSIEFWDSRTGRRRGAPLKAHGKDVLDLAFSPDGRVLASGSEDKTVRLWDVGTRRRAGVLKSHSGTVYAVVFSPDGRWLASTGGDGNVALWDVRAKRRLDQIHVGEKSYDVTFNPKRNELAAGTSSNTVRLIDVKRGARRRAKLSLGRELGEQDEDYSLLDVTYSKDGRRLATASGDTTIEIWDPRNGEHVKTLGAETGHSDSIESVAFSRDGRLLASGGNDRAVFLWDVALGEELGEPLRVNGNWVESVVFSPDGRSLAVGGLDGTISLWDPEEHERAGVRHRLHTEDVNDLTFSPDGKVLATAGDDDVVRLWADHGTRALRPALRGHTDIVWAVDFSPDGKLVAGAGADGTVRLWPTSRKSPRGVALAHGKKGVRAASFAPKGDLLATGGEEGTIKFWDSKTRKQNGKALRAYPGGTVYDLDFSPDGRLLASVGESSSVTLWDVEKRQKVAELEGHTDTIEEVEFSPDGSTVASGSTNNVILFWDVARREPISRPLAEHDNSIRALAFSPDGHTLASGSADETIIFWDVESHRRLGLPLKSHQDEVSAVAFDPTGRFLAASSYDSTYSLWSREFWTHDRKTLEASVCDKVARSLSRVEWEEFLPDEPYRRTCGG